MTLNKAITDLETEYKSDFNLQLAEWLKELKEIKEQQTCEDTISRSSLLEKLDDCYKEKVKIAPDNMAEGFAQVEKLIKQEPPVTPKTGHWIEGQTNNPNIHNILCSCCFEGYPSKGHVNSQYTKERFQYCPKCGARMIES